MIGCLVLSGVLSPNESAWAGVRAEKTKLSNGLTLIVSERRQLPTIHLQVLIRAGSTSEPPQLRGLANLTAELLLQGTSRRTAAQISEKIESVGGALTASGEWDHAVVGLTVLKKDLSLGLDLLSDILLHPLFSQEEINRKVGELKARLKRMEEEPRQVAHWAFLRRLYGDHHPYAFPEEGTPQSLTAIRREDILTFYQDFYRPNNASMVIVGHLSLEEARNLLEPLFKDWQPKSIRRPALAPVSSPSRPGVEKIDRPITQANIVLGHVGIARANPDFYALQVMNYILGGGGFVSRLVDQIRDNLGLTYGIHSYFDAREHPGPFLISVETKNQNANQMISEILREIKKFLEDGVTPTELSEAQDYLTGSFPLRMDSNAKLVRLLTGIELYGLGLDYPEKYPQLIRQVTQEEVQRVASTYLKPDSFLIVVVGNQPEIRLTDRF